MSIGVESDFEYVLDQIGEEHTTGVTTNKHQTKDVDSLPKAAHITKHIKEWVNDSFILLDFIVKAKLGLEIGVRVDGSQSLIRSAIQRYEVGLLRLILVPDQKERISELDLIVVKLDLFPDVFTYA